MGGSAGGREHPPVFYLGAFKIANPSEWCEVGLCRIIANTRLAFVCRGDIGQLDLCETCAKYAIPRMHVGVFVIGARKTQHMALRKHEVGNV